MNPVERVVRLLSDHTVLQGIGVFVLSLFIACLIDKIIGLHWLHIILALIVVMVILYALLYVPKVQSHGMGASAQNFTNECRRTLAHIMGGGLVLMGLFVTSRQLVTSVQEQIAERLTKAIDQLGAVNPNDGSPNLEIRMGGIYSLERIIQISENDCPAIVEILSSYVRKNSSICSDAESLENPREVLSELCSQPRIDLRAAISVLGKVQIGSSCFYNFEEAPRQLDFGNTNLAGISFDGYKMVSADFSQAALNNSIVIGSNLDHTNFEGARLIGTGVYKSSFKEAIFNFARLDKAQLYGSSKSKMDFTFSQFIDASLSNAKLQYVDFTRSIMKAAHFTDSTIENCDFKLVDLVGSNFRRARIFDSDFTHAMVPNSDFEEAQLNSLSFESASLRESNFKKAVLIKCDLDSAILAGADFTEATLRDCALSDERSIKLIGATFINVAAPAPFLDWAARNGATIR